MMKKIVFSFLTFLLLAALPLSAAKQPAFFYQWQKLSDKRLLAMGYSFINQFNAPDSALACFTIVANRYDTKADGEERYDAAKGFIGKWYVYFFYYFDYYKAYESLSHAEELARGYEDEMVRVLLNFGCMYQTLADQTDDQNTRMKAFNYYRQCLQLAFKCRSGDVDMAFANLISVSYDLGRMPYISREWAIYRRLPLPSKIGIRAFNHLFYEANILMSKGKYAEAQRKYDHVLEQNTEEVNLNRFSCAALMGKAEALSAMRDNKSAVASLYEALRLSQRHNLKDAILEIYEKLYKCYAKMGDKEKSLTFRGQYLQLKDTLLNYQQLMKVNEMRFVSSMNKADEQMRQVRHRQQIERIVGVLAFIIAIITAVFLWIVWRKNRRLNIQNVRLYERTVEMIRKEKEEQLRRKSLEDEVEQYKQKDNKKKEKYQYNNLDTTDKSQLCEQIQAVMESSPEIYSPDFTAAQLATMVGSKYKYVSQVINEIYGCNFSTFLNEYRIKEACRRIGDRERYGNLTTEAIAHDVGFKSRTTFIASFKKVTGLTPSEYIRISLSR